MSIGTAVTPKGELPRRPSRLNRPADRPRILLRRVGVFASCSFPGQSAHEDSNLGPHPYQGCARRLSNFFAVASFDVSLQAGRILLPIARSFNGHHFRSLAIIGNPPKG